MCFFKKSTHFFLFLLHGHLKTKLVSVGKKTIHSAVLFHNGSHAFYSYSVTRIFRNGHMVFKNNVFAKAVCNIYAQLFIFFVYFNLNISVFRFFTAMNGIFQSV